MERVRALEERVRELRERRERVEARENQPKPAAKARTIGILGAHDESCVGGASRNCAQR